MGNNEYSNSLIWGVFPTAIFFISLVGFAFNDFYINK